MHICARREPRRRFLPPPNPPSPLRGRVERWTIASPSIHRALLGVAARCFAAVTVFQGKVPELGSCRSCQVIVRYDSFRHRDALRTFTDGVGTCQLCQDLTSAGIETTQALRHGAVVGFALDGCNEADFIVDIAFLPFRNCPARRWYEWEPRYALRITRDHSQVDPWHELMPMAEPWRHHQVRVRDFQRADDPILLERLREFDLLVAPDSTWLDAAVGRFSGLSCASRLPLSTVLRSSRDGPLSTLRSWAWTEGLLPYIPAPDEPFSSLRTCALLAAFLDRSSVFAASSVRPMDLVLDWSMAQGGAVASEVAS